MTLRIHAIYSEGAFRPETPCDIAENAKVELLVHETDECPVAVAGDEERLRVLRRVTDRMQQNPLPSNTPRFTRDELHERG